MTKIRGLEVEEALNVLKFSTKKAAAIMRKVLESAIANAEHNESADIDELKVSTVFEHPYFDFLSAKWPLYVRVGANSPNLWPTIFSETNTGICWRPLCTAIVKPSISGEIIDRLDQVLIGFLLLLLTASSTARWW
jgi:hypothetical protein